MQRDDEAEQKGRLDRDHKTALSLHHVWLSFISNRENVALAGVEHVVAGLVRHVHGVAEHAQQEVEAVQ